MRRSQTTIDWHRVRCMECGSEMDIDTCVRAPAGDGYPIGARVAVCSQECAEAWHQEHRRVPTTLFGGP